MNFRRSSSFSIRTIVMVMIAAGILVLAIGGFLNPVIDAAFRPIIRVQAWIASRYAAINDLLTAPRDVATLRLRNQELETENSQLRSQIVELRQQANLIQQLSALVDFARTNPAYEYISATVIGQDPSPFLKYVIINLGTDDGIRRGMPVVTAQGLLGRVEAASASAARVQLITDAGSVANVTLEQSGVDAVLSGSVTGALSLDLIPQEVTVTPGELVLTSGLGGNYPPNLIIGQVTSIRSRSFDLFQTASVQPAVDFTQLDIVLVIRNFRPVDISPLVPNP